MRTVVFILSCEWSGSTWLGYVLGSHADAAFLGEYSQAWLTDLPQPCSWCAAKGRTECEVLHGIGQVPVERAYDFAFDRLMCSTLVDSSKNVEWLARQIESKPDFQIKIIHLIRDPRGWHESRRRRYPQFVLPSLDYWCDVNKRIADFARATGLPHVTVFYDEVAGQPVSELPALCDFLGMTFDPAALQYWRKVHHGFSANGASTPVLKQAAPAASGLQVITADDAFYSRNEGRLFLDERWKTRLPETEQRLILDDVRVQRVMSRFGRTLTADGIQRSNGHNAAAAELNSAHNNRNRNAAARSYSRRHPAWPQRFRAIAEQIATRLKPRTVLDFGCADGRLVHCLRDHGVEAFGLGFFGDELVPEAKPYCRDGSPAGPLRERYDLITCIEIHQQLPDADAQAAIQNVTAAADTVLFSSTPDDYSDPMHINVRPIIDWLRGFATCSFAPDVDFDGELVSPQAMLLRRAPAPPSDELLRWFASVRNHAVVRAAADPLHPEISILKKDLEAKTAALNAIMNSKGWRFLERCRTLRARVLRSA